MAKKAAKKNVFVGREKEIDTIKGIIKNEPKANILISGVTGMGKTELCIQIKKLLAENKKIHCGSYRVESKLEDPVNPFLVALFEVFESITLEKTAKKKPEWFKNVFAKKLWKGRKGIGAAVLKDGLGTIVKNLTEKVEVGETSSQVVDILKEASSEWSTKSTLDELLAQNKPAVINTYLALLRQISEQSPDGHKFVLILDQVENTTEVFQEFLKSIVGNLPEKFYLVFALNDEMPDGLEFVKNHRAHLMRFKTKPVELPGLEKSEINQLIDGLRGVYKTPDVVEKVRKLSDGRPLMITQWINSEDFDLSVIDEEKLTLYGYYGDNLNAAGSEAKKLATVLSLLPFPLEGGLSDYAGIMGISNFECSELLDKLEAKNIFRRYGKECCFSHGLIKEYIFNNTQDVIKKEAAEQIIGFLKKKYKKQLAARQLSPARIIQAELLPFTEDYQASFDHNYELGQHHYRISAYETAREHFQNALEAAEHLNDQSQVGNVLNRLGLIYDAWSRYDQALDYYQKSLKISQDLVDRKGEGAILNNIGEIYRAWGKYDQAIRYYKKSLKITEEMGDRQGEGASLNNIGGVYDSCGKYYQAIEYYKKSLEIREEVGDRRGEGVTLNNVGMVYDSWGKYDQAIEYYEKSLKIKEEMGDRQGAGVTLNNIGSVYDSWGNYDHAIEYFKKSLEIFEEVGDRQGEGVTLNNIGGVYHSWGKYDQAIEYYEKSLKIKEELGDRQGEGVSLNSIGEIHRVWGKYDQAIEYFKKSLEIAEEVGERQSEGVSLNNIGNIYRAWGKYDQAIEYFKKSLKIAEEVGDRKGEGVSLNNIGSVYDSWGNYDLAIEYYKKDLQICKDIGYRGGEACSLNNIAGVYHTWGKYDEAAEYYTKSLKILEDTGAVEAKAVRENLKRLQEKMKK